MKKQDIQAEIEFFDKIAEEQDHFDTIAEDGYVEIFNNIGSYISGDVLEAGCGTGAFGSRINNLGLANSITGVDINQKFIDLARKTYLYKKLLCANLEDRKILEVSSFNTIICPYILHHFPDMKDVIDNFYYWLKPGGYLVIIDPNGSNLILRASHILRLVLSKFIDTKSSATVNESHKQIYKFEKCLKKYRICEIKTFKHKIGSKTKLFPLTLIKSLTIVREILLKLYSLNPFTKFNGSDLIIIAKKDR